MDHPGDSPDSARRRVWWFVFGSLFVVAVVGLWPIKGYRIDGDRFASSLGPLFLEASSMAGIRPTVGLSATSIIFERPVFAGLLSKTK